MDQSTPVKLTSFSRGAGCGCKIAPALLQEIVRQKHPQQTDPFLLVGHATNDDAAVYSLGNGTALISSTDFFSPIVDDAYAYGQIAAANAISDIYAMGGKPLLAIAVLGWPVDKLPAALANEVLEGARNTCAKAGIQLAGGHSIDSAEPFFGLSVNGLVEEKNIKKNSGATEGDILFLTKPIGVGILSTAQKRDKLAAEHYETMLEQMIALNSLGEKLGKETCVTSMTDVTGFGLMGHLIEMAEGSNLSAELNYALVPIVAGAKEYMAERIVPDATFRNWNSYSKKVEFSKDVNVMEAFTLLPDPQTNGGLLFSVKAESVEVVITLLSAEGFKDCLQPIGKMIPKSEKLVYVK